MHHLFLAIIIAEESMPLPISLLSPHPRLLCSKKYFIAYTQYICEMSDLFFWVGGQNHARYLTSFPMFMVNIETHHPVATDLLKRGAISVARLCIPGNRCTVDNTIKDTFMKRCFCSRSFWYTGKLQWSITRMDQVRKGTSKVCVRYPEHGRYAG